MAPNYDFSLLERNHKELERTMSTLDLEQLALRYIESLQKKGFDGNLNRLNAFLGLVYELPDFQDRFMEGVVDLENIDFTSESYHQSPPSDGSVPSHVICMIRNMFLSRKHRERGESGFPVGLGIQNVPPEKESESILKRWPEAKRIRMSQWAQEVQPTSPSGSSSSSNSSSSSGRQSEFATTALWASKPSIKTTVRFEQIGFATMPASVASEAPEEIEEAESVKKSRNPRLSPLKKILPVLRSKVPTGRILTLPIDLRPRIDHPSQIARPPTPCRCCHQCYRHQEKYQTQAPRYPKTFVRACQDLVLKADLSLTSERGQLWEVIHEQDGLLLLRQLRSPSRVWAEKRYFCPLEVSEGRVGRAQSILAAMPEGAGSLDVPL